MVLSGTKVVHIGPSLYSMSNNLSHDALHKAMRSTAMNCSTKVVRLICASCCNSKLERLLLTLIQLGAQTLLSGDLYQTMYLPHDR
jgi:hypothetical protein